MRLGSVDQAEATPQRTVTKTTSADAYRRSEPRSKRHDKQRYNSLTDGVGQLRANNSAIADSISEDVIASARARLRQNGSSSDAPSSATSVRYSSGGGGDGIKTTTTLPSNRSREGDAGSASSAISEKKPSGEQKAKKEDEISFEMQYFINRNKSRALGSRSFDSSTFAVTDNSSSTLVDQSTPSSKVKPDPVYSGRTYGLASAHKAQPEVVDKVTPAQSGAAVEDNVFTVDRVKAASRIFGATVTRDKDSHSAKVPLHNRFSSSSSSHFTADSSSKLASNQSNATSHLVSRSMTDFSQSGARTQAAAKSVSSVPPPPPVVQTQSASGRTGLGAIGKSASTGSEQLTTTGSGLKSSANAKKTNSRSRFEPKLDPREELMIAVRNAGKGLKQVKTDDFNKYANNLES